MSATVAASAGSALAARVELRPGAAEDRPFQDRVYASTRQEELAMTGWPQDAIEAFLQDQSRLQLDHYLAHYPGADLDVVRLDGQDAGRLFVHRQAHEIRIMDIALLPECRRLGIGALLLGTLVAESEALGCPLTLHVEFNNPIRDFYFRLGFLDQEANGIYILMKREPAPREA